MENPPPHEPPHCVIPLHKPSKKEYIFFLATGIVISIPFAAFFEALFPSTALASLLLIVVGAPFIEELAKVFPLFYRHGETERSIVTLGLLIGLGFGIAEFASTSPWARRRSHGSPASFFTRQAQPSPRMAWQKRTQSRTTSSRFSCI